MNKVLSFLSSMKTMAALMLVFAVAIGYATFVENDYGSMTAKADIYNARWFEILLALLAVNLTLNIINFNMARRGKWLVFTFHAAFLIILVGAAVTRYMGYEGAMHIREGESSDVIISAEPYVTFNVVKGEKTFDFKENLFLSKRTSNHFERILDVDGEQIHVKLESYMGDAHYEAVADPKGSPLFNLMVTGAQGAQQVSLKKGEFVEANDIVIDFDSNKTFDKPVIALSVEGEKAYVTTPAALSTLSMDTQQTASLNAGKHEILKRTLFQSAQSGFVFRDFLPKASMQLVSKPAKGPMVQGEDAITLTLSRADKKESIVVLGSVGEIGEGKKVALDDMVIEVAYGSIERKIPFAVALRDFELERYPGSMSPASYASEVSVIDPANQEKFDFRIYMNHILDYQGYRFFQSSFDQDELGTVLSVNRDPGTLITYIGYLLLAIGMFGVLIVKNGRFAALGEKLKSLDTKKAAAALAIIVMTLGTTNSIAAEAENPVIKVAKGFDKAHADKFGHLIVQDSSGRMKPMDTLSHEILAKLNRNDTFMGLSSNQVVLGMMLRPDAWREIAIIRTGDKEVNKLIGLPEGAKTAAFAQFFEFPDEISGYKLAQLVDEANRKAPGKRDKFDKALLQVDERVNVAYMVYTGSLVRMWPKANDKNHKWDATIEALQGLSPKESEMVRLLAIGYFGSIDEAMKSGDWKKADEALARIDKFQRFVGASVYPNDTKSKVEIFYNKANVFEQLWPLYFVVGFTLLILSFIKIIKPAFREEWLSKVSFSLLVLFFAAHTAGLVMRWYISGHAPWSNGYESMIYIGWASVLAGFIFSKRSMMTMAATAIMTGLILFVAHLNWMDPQVTNLVPVLQSYWLAIHVAMITASYGFLGLGALLGMITLILFILKNEKNSNRLNLAIKELNAINEMSLIVGLVLLTIGNFLGGVWANESWGRYWGWDPKETWALVTILVYAVVIHLRMIKGAYSDYIFSVVSLLAFTAVLMTYFGVNYYLAGMHSYAKGDPVPVPDFVPWTYAVIAIVIAMAYPKRSTR
ncbi:cytochrome c biogenesis protein CcsA [Sulfuricurvum sp. RIFCSPLOWO2_12_FULL_43_24]|uniref:cytochrome c biogenesis protein CcsA n=1 Tax=Sulfuricurvum sp. RIFCSPLOWO2_12_FULL_43_24 TaxID=1802247 RepID=UPI0008D3100C|nr:cytochrome c biogenesis protein CcsA [Sulfuricurvum sp. RIFCSPLOWO2_12_FULL_43_24]OHD88409.1 MAG: cytochrome C biogenesis protein [Sulfuricurvum sp. RIFCSPLOWO2_12_FULL_43_24]